jgi:hypothetical protein
VRSSSYEKSASLGRRTARVNVGVRTQWVAVMCRCDCPTLLDMLAVVKGRKERSGAQQGLWEVQVNMYRLQIRD